MLTRTIIKIIARSVSAALAATLLFLSISEVALSEEVNRQEIKSEVEGMIKAYDRGAVVLVFEAVNKDAPVNDEVKSPFNIAGASTKSSIHIKIMLSGKKELPTTFVDLLKDKLKKLHPSITSIDIGIEKLPGEPQGGPEIVNNISVPKFPDVINGTLSGIEDLTKAIDNAKGDAIGEIKLWRDSTKGAMDIISYVLMGVAVTTFSILILLFILSGRRINNAVSTLSSAMAGSKDGSGLSVQAEGSGNMAVGIADAISDSLRQGLASLGKDPKGSGINSLPLKSVKAIIFDLYWSSSDAEAAHIVSEMFTATKEELVKDQKVANYLDFLTTVNPSHSAIADEPYYLKPLDIAHLGNEALTSLVRRSPELYILLPDIRIRFLLLSSAERLEMERFVAEKGSHDNKNIESSLLDAVRNEPPTAARRLLKTRLITPASVEEETSLADSKLAAADKAKLLSFILASSELEDGQLKDLLLSYDAKTLASCWVGPESVLTRLEDVMDSGKVKLIKAYTTKVPPTRNAVMRAICAKAAVLTSSAMDRKDALSKEET